MKKFISSILILLSLFSPIIYAKQPAHYIFYPSDQVANYLEKSNEVSYFKKGIKNKELSDSECLAYVLYAEARGEPDEGKIGVAFVVRNRSLKNEATLCDIVRERFQFVPYIKKLYDKADKDSWLYALIVASYLVDEKGFDHIKSPVGPSLYFNSLHDEEQSIMSKDRFIRKIGHHYFYK